MKGCEYEQAFIDAELVPLICAHRSLGGADQYPERDNDPVISEKLYGTHQRSGSPAAWRLPCAKRAAIHTNWTARPTR